MLEQAEFYQSHLDRVSRSFAFCIRQLNEPLRAWVGLSYLLCRVLDTVEDSPWASQEARFRAFAQFDAAMDGDSAVLAGWEKDFPSGIDVGEFALLIDAEVIIQDLHALPAPVRLLITELVLSMSRGMQHFARTSDDGRLRLASLSEVNQYCFFVAGLVGELLAKLLAAVDPHYALDDDTVLRAHHFGQFLQKVNLLKDQVTDENSGRHLIPSRAIVEASAERNALQAYAFLCELPKEQLEFRRFCAWSLFLGLEAVHASRASLAAGQVVKVTRDRATEIITQVEDMLEDDAVMAAHFAAAFRQLNWVRQEPSLKSGKPLPDWLLRLYQGRLDAAHLGQLDLSL